MTAGDLPTELSAALARPEGAGERHQSASRESLAEVVDNAYRLALERGSGLSVVIAGLDGFRMVNDTLGPVEADAVLGVFAACLSGPLQDVMHVGGDQLLGLVPRSGALSAINLAEALREDVASTIHTPMGRIRASFGVASHPDSARSAAELVYGAQSAMYWAKSRGGNRVGYWGEITGADPGKRPELSVDPLSALAGALERKVRAGAGQLARSAWYAAKVAQEMGVNADEQRLIEAAALLHDVGKLTVPDRILQKPGSLSEEEKAVVKGHPAAGAEIVRRLEGLAAAAPIIAHHHEHYDGSGYPDGLVGGAIPLGSRIILVADAFDAITSDRPYRDARSHAVALEELVSGRGTQFDPEVVDALVKVMGAASPTEATVAGES